MIVDTEYLPKTKKLRVSYFDKSGSYGYQDIKWEKVIEWEICNKSDTPFPKYTTWDKLPVKAVNTKRPNKHSVRYRIDELPEAERAALLAYSEPTLYVIDIETEAVAGGFSPPNVAANRILTISITRPGRALVFGLKPLNDAVKDRIQRQVHEHLREFNVSHVFMYKHFADEVSMLVEFIKLFSSSSPKLGLHAITGWNVLAYDWQYIYHRLARLSQDESIPLKVRNELDLEKTSPTGSMRPITLETRLKGKETIRVNGFFPRHKFIVDYMDLFQKWGGGYIKVKESNALDYVAEQLLGVKKVAYPGTLDTLYEQDFEKFIFYNIVDCILVELIHEKTKLLNIMYAISEKAGIEIGAATSAVNVTEGLLRRDLKKNHNIVFTRADNASVAEKIKGGFVAKAKLGLSRWLVVFDFASLYPTIMREMLICPEGYLGMLQPDGERVVLHDKEVIYDSKTMVKTTYGAIFSRKPSSTINIITNLFAERKSHKKDMLKAKSRVGLFTEVYNRRFV